VIHSTKLYMPVSANKSPFNLGLRPFNRDQVQDWAKRQGQDWSGEDAQQLTGFVNRNTYLVRVAVYHIGRGDVTLEQVLHNSPIWVGIYGDRLQRQLWNLQHQPELLAAFVGVLKSSTPVELDVVEAFKLESMGLVNLQGNLAMVSCDLFRQNLGDFSSS